ncbi:hypothetical protein B0I35DRAFT_70957 [Stachybotrys elegans]|uniref:Indole-diterpene biosynthesis protein PaxU n=1 Tax=Stachybotrys elegans TaxID=80388 RepID=A0A8K0WNB3_9HYPO|nr:hypothetical protein B0I35DRAFT_70957 [Stachybotrys elegans]
MASDQPVVTGDSALSFMQKLSPAVSYFEPDGPVAENDPELIVVMAWWMARDAHLAKYVTQHRALFPTSRVLVVRSTWGHALSEARGYAELAAAARVIQARAADANGGTRTRMLMHVFSNGGTGNAVKVSTLLRRENQGKLVMPRHVTIWDSCPGYQHWNRTHRALSDGMPLWTSPLIHIFMAVMWVMFAAQGRQAPADENAKAINKPDILESEARRAYIYGTQDVMVDWKDVEDHAAKAKQIGFNVRLERFGGKHVAHMKEDSDRYWRVVKEVWEDS